MYEHDDRPEDKNLAWDLIQRDPEVFVSSAMRYTYPPAYGGPMRCYETWIFSDDARVRTQQIHHICEPDALKAHAHIVRNLRAIFNEQI